MIYLGQYGKWDYYWYSKGQAVCKNPLLQSSRDYTWGMVPLMRIHDDEVSYDINEYREAVIQMGKLGLLDKLEIDEIFNGCYDGERKVG